jgi:hypothetical protein
MPNRKNSIFDFGRRTYSARRGEWTSAKHEREGVPGFSRVERYKGQKIYKEGDIWKTGLDPETDFDSKRDVKAFIDYYSRRNPLPVVIRVTKRFVP